jgi:hypothetical protein
MFEVQPTALQDATLKVQNPPLEVQDTVNLKVQPTARESCNRESCNKNRVSKANNKRISSDAKSAPEVSGSFVAAPKNKQLPKSEKSDTPLSARADTDFSAQADEDEDDALDVIETFLDEPETEPEDYEDPNNHEWVAQRVLDSAPDWPASEIIRFLRSEIASRGRRPPNWQWFPAVLNHGYQRLTRLENGVHWPASDLAAVRKGLANYMGIEPPQGFEGKCELRASGASARNVLALLLRRWEAAKYRPGHAQGPRGWTWFLQVIGNEFNPAERGRVAEHPAKVREDAAQASYNDAAFKALDLPTTECDSPW